MQDKDLLKVLFLLKITQPRWARANVERAMTCLRNRIKPLGKVGMR